jgi:hypothetical protein
MDSTYGIACPICVWMIDNQASSELIERALLAHVRDRHPEELAQVVAQALDGVFSRPSIAIDSVVTATGYEATCRACLTTVSSEDERVIDNWPPVHIFECPAVGWPGDPKQRLKYP